MRQKEPVAHQACTQNTVLLNAITEGAADVTGHLTPEAGISRTAKNATSFCFRIKLDNFRTISALYSDNQGVRYFQYPSRLTLPTWGLTAAQNHWDPLLRLIIGD